MNGYLRYPTIAATRLAFSCEDDLWIVGTTGGAARRLTAGVSEASHPRLSPDGQQVAFVGADDGPTEVYVVATAGGTARRLTHQAARCAVLGWHPQTGDIIYASTAEQPAAFGFRLFAVDSAGGAPRLLPYGPATAVSFGPDGGIVLGRNGADPARWKRYRGGATGELWIDAAGDGMFEQLRPVAGNAVNPCWVGERVYFVSDHDGVGNVYSCLPDGSGLRRHTDHQDYYARNLTADGTRLTYHAGGDLYLLDPAAPAGAAAPAGPAAYRSCDGSAAPGDARRVEITVATSRAQTGRRFVGAADFLNSAVLSPDGTSIAMVARGKAFTMAHWSGPVRQLGTPDGVRYRHLSWVSDDQLVAVAADDRPEERLAFFTADGEVELSLGDLGCVTELLPAPAGGRVAFATNRHELFVAEGGAVSRIDRSPHERIEDLAWSPDGRWLAYSYPDTPLTSVIKVADVPARVTHRISQTVLRDVRPTFDPGGRYLYFIGQRDVRPELDQVQLGVDFPFGARPYLVTLRADEPSPFVPRPVPRPSEPEPPDTVDIDFTDIERRVVPFPVRESRYAGIVGLHRKVLLLSVPVTAPDPLHPDRVPDGTVTAVDLHTNEVTDEYLDRVDELCVNRDTSVLLYRSDTRLRVLDATAEREESDFDFPGALPGRESGWIDLDRVKVGLRPAAEWRQMFREAWRLQRESFWSSDMSGLDWVGMYQRYLPLVDRVASRSELSDLIWELQGELGCSHAYERGGEYRQPTMQPQGFLGVDWAVDGDSWRIAQMLRGDPWNPDVTSACNRPGVDIRVGDAVVAINGQPVGRAGPGALLVGQAKQEVELTLARAGVPLRRVAVRALADESPVRYRDWVTSRRAYVHSASDGRLGYLHVPDMFQAGYAEFIRGFLGELDCEGLVVDVRFNTGGFASTLLLEKLARARAGVEHGRWSGVVPFPPESPRGPMIAIVNEQTGSDGEIFSHRFRALGLGPLVGNRTWGGVVATWPRHQLADGTVTTQPEFRYFLTGIDDGLENHGVVPDLHVIVAPQFYQLDEDLQLAGAVRCLLETLDYKRSADRGEEVMTWCRQGPTCRPRRSGSPPVNVTCGTCR